MTDPLAITLALIAAVWSAAFICWAIEQLWDDLAHEVHSLFGKVKS